MPQQSNRGTVVEDGRAFVAATGLRAGVTGEQEWTTVGIPATIGIELSGIENEVATGVSPPAATPSPHPIPPTQAVRSMQVAEEATPSKNGRRLVFLRPGDGDHRHGTVGGYSNHQCRCPECTDAWNAYGRELRRRKREARDA